MCCLVIVEQNVGQLCVKCDGAIISVHTCAGFLIACIFTN